MHTRYMHSIGSQVQDFIQKFYRGGGSETDSCQNSGENYSST